MPGRFDEPEFDEWDDDPEGPQACDLTDDDDDETPTVPCPQCRRPIPDFVDRCPYCGNWVVQSAGTAGSSRPWLVIAALLALAAFVAWYVL
jgi:hypothetical protein